MRRFLPPLALTALALVSSCARSRGPPDARSFTVFVDSRRGNDGHNCGTIANPCKTFQFAVDYVAALGKVIAEGVRRVRRAQHHQGRHRRGCGRRQGSHCDSVGHGDRHLRAATPNGHGEGTDSRVAAFPSGLGPGHPLRRGPRAARRGVHHRRIRDRHLGGRAGARPPVRERHDLSFLLLWVELRLTFVNDARLVRPLSLRGRHLRFPPAGERSRRGVGLRLHWDAGGGSRGVGGAPGTRVELNLENCLIAHNGDTGILSSGRNGGSATIRISGCTIADKGNGVVASQGGVVLSRGNNRIEGNGKDVVGTLGNYAGK